MLLVQEHLNLEASSFGCPPSWSHLCGALLAPGDHGLLPQKELCPAASPGCARLLVSDLLVLGCLTATSLYQPAPEAQGAIPGIVLRALVA